MYFYIVQLYMKLWRIVAYLDSCEHGYVLRFSVL